MDRAGPGDRWDPTSPRADWPATGSRAGAPAGSGGPSDTTTLTAPVSLAVPKGGGAIAGLGETLTTSPVLGSASLSVPLGAPPGRSGFGPALALGYDSAAGNGVFGLGWELGLPAIARRTERGVPLYHDDDEIVVGAEQVVPVLDGAGAVVESDRTVHGTPYRIRRYRPRVDSDHRRIERWTATTDPADVRWRILSADDVTTWYGTTAESRVSDPADPRRIAVWLPCESYDDAGNAVVYSYVAEDSRGIDAGNPAERNRTAAGRSTNRYLAGVRYGNATPYRPQLTANGTPTPLPDTWFFSVVLDYGDHDGDLPGPEPSGPWPARPDPFSSHRTGFEVRTYRRCRRVLVYHQFPELGPAPVLVRSTVLDYATEGAEIVSLLTSVTRVGHGVDGAGQPTSAALPELRLSYRPATPDGTVRAVDLESAPGAPAGIDGLAYEWVDLDGDGVSGILARTDDAWYYTRNLSPLSSLEPTGRAARFAAPVVVRQRPAGDRSIPAQRNQPTGSASSAPAAPARPMLADLTGDGRLDWVDLAGTAPGLSERAGQDGWTGFRPFGSAPAIDWDDPNLRFVDLTGDGLADVLVAARERSVWYPALGLDGFGPGRPLADAGDQPETGPVLLFSDGTGSVLLADMDGDGLVDLAKRPEAEPLPPPRLLGAYDPLLLGWTSRDEVVGPHKILVTNNGLFRPFALVEGRAVARWGLSGGKVTIEHLGKVSKKDAAALEEDAERVREFLGMS